MTLDYRPRPEELLPLIEQAVGASARLAELPAFADYDAGLQAEIAAQAGRFIAERIAPLQRVGDEVGARVEGGTVRMPPGFAEAHRALVAQGWLALSAPAAIGGQGLPFLLEALLFEWLSAANHGFTMAPGLLHGAVECIRHHADAELQARYLPHLATGEWLATMCLTEAHAGSDLGQVRTLAVPQPDGSLRVGGSKIFISGGEHDLCENIVHLVLCRQPGAPDGPKGLSLALVPKVLPDGTRNAVVCERIEHKMGLHASPTCAMRFDDAVGWPVGEPGRGLAAMFVMMNAARLHVALQGIGLLDAAWQKADAYARERRQMRAPGTPPESRGGEAADLLVEHPAMRRILDTQRGWIDGLRVAAYRTAVELDVARHHPEPRRRAAAERFCALLTPVLKAGCTQQGFEGASACLQVFGGHGYVREWGIEQIVRDARVTMIYEGTNEIQAIDLVTRKVLPDGGRDFSALMVALRDELDASRPFEADVQRRLAQLRYLATSLCMAAQADPRLPHAVADDFLRATLIALVAWSWARLQATVLAGREEACAAWCRHALPEFEMRLGMVRRACEEKLQATSAPAASFTLGNGPREASAAT